MLQVGDIVSLHPLTPLPLGENILGRSSLLYLKAVSVGCASPSAQLLRHGARAPRGPTRQSDHEPKL